MSDPAQHSPVIEFRKVAYRFSGGMELLAGLDLQVRRGETLSFARAQRLRKNHIAEVDQRSRDTERRPGARKAGPRLNGTPSVFGAESVM